MALSGFLSEDFRAELKALIKEALREELRTVTSRGDPDNEGLVDVKEAAAYLSVTPSWLYKKASSLPFSKKIGGARRFDRRGMRRWLESQRR